jgi:hypothetical protein
MQTYVSAKNAKSEKSEANVKTCSVQWLHTVLGYTRDLCRLYGGRMKYVARYVA